MRALAGLSMHRNWEPRDVFHKAYAGLGQACWTSRTIAADALGSRWLADRPSLRTYSKDQLTSMLPTTMRITELPVNSLAPTAATVTHASAT